MKTIAFFNNKGGVGKTSLVYHLSWMFQDLGLSVIAADLDPQSNLTADFFLEDRLDRFWSDEPHSETILGAITPLMDHLGDLKAPHVENVTDYLEIRPGGLGVIPGDLGLSRFEDRLAEAWPKCLEDNPASTHDAFRVTTAFYRAVEMAANERKAEVVLIDVGPSLGAINRAVLVAADYVVVPLTADLFSLQGLRNLGPKLREWRQGWEARKKGKVPPNLSMPSGDMRPIGYVVLQHAVRSDRPVKAYSRWLERIPHEYANAVLGQAMPFAGATPDPSNLATIKHYRSLMPMAQDARKPIFYLKPGDGALGGHTQAVRDCYEDFERLARAIAAAVKIPIP